jgi:hypothetical protein
MKKEKIEPISREEALNVCLEQQINYRLIRGRKTREPIVVRLKERTECRLCWRKTTC